MAIFSHYYLRAAPGVVAFAIPNGGNRNRREAGRMKLQGVLAGVSDTCWLKPGGVAHFLEIKRGRRRSEITGKLLAGPSLSVLQEEFQMRAEAVGCVCAVACGLDEALAVLEGWGMLV